MKARLNKEEAILHAFAVALEEYKPLSLWEVVESVRRRYRERLKKRTVYWWINRLTEKGYLKKLGEELGNTQRGPYVITVEGWERWDLLTNVQFAQHPHQSEQWELQPVRRGLDILSLVLFVPKQQELQAETPQSAITKNPRQDLHWLVRDKLEIEALAKEMGNLVLHRLYKRADFMLSKISEDSVLVTSPFVKDKTLHELRNIITKVLSPSYSQRPQ